MITTRLPRRIMTNESINDKLKKLITKVNSIQGSLLSMGKRLTALEEKPTLEKVEFGITMNPKFLKWYSEVFPDEVEEVEEIGGTESDEVLDQQEEGIQPNVEDEEISPEVLESLDEIIEG